MAMNRTVILDEKVDDIKRREVDLLPKNTTPRPGVNARPVALPSHFNVCLKPPL
jgi:hypothetical protein